MGGVCKRAPHPHAALQRGCWGGWERWRPPRRRMWSAPGLPLPPCPISAPSAAPSSSSSSRSHHPLLGRGWGQGRPTPSVAAAMWWRAGGGTAPPQAAVPPLVPPPAAEDSCPPCSGASVARTPAEADACSGTGIGRAVTLAGSLAAIEVYPTWVHIESCTRPISAERSQAIAQVDAIGQASGVGGQVRAHFPVLERFRPVVGGSVCDTVQTSGKLNTIESEQKAQSLI